MSTCRNRPRPNLELRRVDGIKDLGRQHPQCPVIFCRITLEAGSLYQLDGVPDL